MNNWVYVIAAFSVTWVMLLGYLFHLRNVSRRSRALLDRATAARSR